MDLNGSIKNINKNIDFYKTLKSPMKSTKVQKRGQIAATRQGVWVHVLGKLVTVQAVVWKKVATWNKNHWGQWRYGDLMGISGI